MSRSTAPAAGCPCTVEPRNRYADDEATAPAATTPLMKLRRDVDCGTSSDMFFSSIAGSPRRGRRSDQKERDFYPTHDIPYRRRVQTISRRFCRGSTPPSMSANVTEPGQNLICYTLRTNANRHAG